jgi:NTE family protein
MLRRLAPALFLLSVLTGCTREFINQPLVGQASNTEVLPIPADPRISPDQPYIIMSFSGGGVRASALAYAVLQELANISDRSGHALTDDVRIISSASGGSVTAAWFGLHGAGGLATLHDAFLAQDNMTPLELQVLNPATLAKLAGPSYSRIDVLREYLDRKLFDGSTFARLYGRKGAPIVVLNATDMARGEVFSFEPGHFDDLCSDLSQFPVSAAVAASAAFPIALTPLSLKNWRSDTCQVDARPLWVRQALASTGGTRFINLPVYKDALETERIRSGQVLYVHLLDGGLVDNLGTSALLQALLSPTSQYGQLFKVNTDRIRNLVAIEVNARSESPEKISVRPATPGVLSVIGAVIGNPIDSATRGNAEIFATTIGQLRASGLVSRVYAIQVDFDQFDAMDPDQVRLRDRVKQIPTSWTIGAAMLGDVEAAAQRLLAQHPCFIQLKADLSGVPVSNTVRARCNASAPAG